MLRIASPISERAYFKVSNAVKECSKRMEMLVLKPSCCDERLS